MISAPNITVGDYTYYDDAVDLTGFEKNNVLFNYPVFGDKLIIGKFCQLASGTKFIMGPANHRLCSATTYPFNVFGGAWTENTPPHLDQLPRKGDIVIGMTCGLVSRALLCQASRSVMEPSLRLIQWW